MKKAFESHVDGYYDVENQLSDHVRKLARKKFLTRDRERDSIDTVEAFEARRDRLREDFFEAVGGLPDGDAPLNPRVSGSLEREGYTIENVVFESQQNFYVTSNYYRPTDAEGEIPAVLLLCGHSDAGKAEPLYQRVAIDLVRNGIAVLVMDPIGQGERHQYYDPETDSCPRRTTEEHTYLDRLYRPAGASVARHLIWDAMRAVEYLRSRPEVDDDRIGVTGNSGGGTQTAYMMLADERLAAAFPGCFITSREAYMPTGQPQDGEQIVHGSIDTGPTYDDFVAAFAPKPVRIGSARWDYFPVEGAERSYERAREVYALYDAAENVDIVFADETHGYSPPLREAAVNWFRKHLLGERADFETGDPAIEDAESLNCTENGEVKSAFRDASTVQDFAREYARDIATDGEEPVDPDVVREAVVEKLDVDLDGDRRPVRPRRIEEEREGDLVWEKVFFPSEEGIVVTGIVARRPDFDSTSGRPTVVLYEEGTAEVRDRESEFADVAREEGFAMAFDPRGVGAVRSRTVNPFEYEGPHGTVYKLNSDALMTGTSLLGMQVYDVVRAADYLADRFDGADGLGIRGYGTGAVRALYAAVLEPTFRHVAVQRVPSFFERTNGAGGFDPWLLVYDVLDDCDLPRLEAALDRRELEWLGEEEEP